MDYLDATLHFIVNKKRKKYLVIQILIKSQMLDNV
jgi:hypothetical protein